MVLDYSTPAVVKIDMTETVGDTIKAFPVELNAQNTIQPWIQDQFDVDPAKRKPHQ